MTKFYITFFAIIILLSFNSLYAEFKLEAQIRPRSEFRNGFKNIIPEGEEATFFTEQRSRIIADYKTEKVNVHISLQDIRMWGATSQIYKSDPSLNNLYEAWASYNFTSNFSFRIGRQALDYDDARFLGNLDWAAQGRSHDALIFIYHDKEKEMRIDFGGAYNQTGFEPTKLFSTYYSGVNNYKTMQFLHAKKKYSSSDIALVIHNDGQQVEQDSSTAFRQTIGMTYNNDGKRIKFGGEAFWQGGENIAKNNISAYFVNAYFTYKTDLTPITIGFDYLSGTSIDDEDDHSFNPLYGTNHKFYGYMDYFYVGNFHGQAATPSGLIDLHLKTKFNIGKNNSLVANLHYFMSEADIYERANEEINSNNKADKYLGTELDLVYNLKLNDNVLINIGYSQMLASESMELVKSGNIDTSRFTNWAWLQINFKPTILSLN